MPLFIKNPSVEAWKKKRDLGFSFYDILCPEISLLKDFFFFLACQMFPKSAGFIRCIHLEKSP